MHVYQQEKDLAAWLLFLKAPGIGPIKQQKLLDAYSEPINVIAAKPSELRALGCSGQSIRFLKRATSHDVHYELNWLQSSDNHYLITQNESSYPALLRNIHSAPTALFIKGDPTTLTLPHFAIVGSRKASMDGKQTAQSFANYLANMGLVIVSGLAHGIDEQAHLGALKTGKTIAVCATGLDIIYPRAHYELAQQISQSSCLISEFLPGTTARKEFFPRRNRLISGLCIGTLVIEAGIKSGSLITAQFALEQNREVFAIPQSIHNPLGKGCHQLIKQGATLAESAEDIFAELIGQFAFLQEQIELSAPDSIKNNSNTLDLNDDELNHVWRHLSHQWYSIDELVQISKMSASTLTNKLLQLELEGRVLADEYGRYRKI